MILLVDVFSGDWFSIDYIMDQWFSGGWLKGGQGYVLCKHWSRSVIGRWGSQRNGEESRTWSILVWLIKNLALKMGYIVKNKID